MYLTPECEAARRRSLLGGVVADHTKANEINPTDATHRHRSLARLMHAGKFDEASLS
jgi:hypothetical protein